MFIDHLAVSAEPLIAPGVENPLASATVQA